MQKEIGSNFDLNPSLLLDNVDVSINIENFNLNGSDYCFLSSGRNALNMVLSTIIDRDPRINKVAVIPSFTCETVIEPFIEMGYEIFYYSIEKNLFLDLSQLREIISKSKAQVVLLHRYFGFDTMRGVESIIREFSDKGVIFIEDITQYLYSDCNYLSVDYTIASLRKWANLLDGGIALCKTGILVDKPVKHNDVLENLKLKASYAKYEYLHEDIGEKYYFLDLFNKAEIELTNNTSYRMSPLSIIIQNKIDIPRMKSKRRDNYERLFNEFKNNDIVKLVTPVLNENDVPLYFVISLNERSSIQKYLRKHDIYAPIVWPKAKIHSKICEEAEEHYNNNLCLPIDQRYDIEDMDRMIEVINDFIKYNYLSK